MGIRSLEVFLRKSVPRGFTEVNIVDEIRKYYDRATEPNPPAPIIVIDLMVLAHAVCQVDYKGQICGGRPKVAFKLLDDLFTRLSKCGAVLEFFCDGTVQVDKYGKWCERQDRSYKGMVSYYDEIDYGCPVEELIHNDVVLIVHGGYPLKQLAKKHGRLTMSIGVECVQESAAFATQKKAFAIVSNDTDYLIYAGTWRLWSAMSINFDTLTTVEYNRQGLLDTLGLTYKEMPLFAVLSGNNLFEYEVLQKFYGNLGDQGNKFENLAKFVLENSGKTKRTFQLYELLRLIVPKKAVCEDLVKRFQKCLSFYDTNFQEPNLNPSEDPVLSVLLEQRRIFPYTAWVGQAKDLSVTFVDVQRHHFGRQFPPMMIKIMSRQAGIFLYHQQKQRKNSDFTRFNLLTKLSHRGGHTLQLHTAEFPPFEPPPLLKLLSSHPKKRASLNSIKLRLYCWIASDTLDSEQLQSVPDELLVTVVTLYCLVENHLLKQFEADLLLQIAYEVTDDAYDHRSAEIPNKFDGRGYRIAFLFIHVFLMFMEAFFDLGLAQGKINEYPPFDGVLFHNRYEAWSLRKQDLKKIKNWRIYEGLPERKITDIGLPIGNAF